MNLSDLFVALQIAINSGTPVPLEEIYSNRESDGQVYYYAAADKALGQDSDNPAKIDGNRLRLGFEVSTNNQQGFVDFAQSEIKDYAKAEGDTFNLLKPLIKNKTPSEVMSLYKSSGLNGVLLPYQFSPLSGSWIEFSINEFSQESKMILTYKEIIDGQVKEIKAISKGDDYRVDDVVVHWESLIKQYRTQQNIN